MSIPVLIQEMGRIAREELNQPWCQYVTKRFLFIPIQVCGKITMRGIDRCWDHRH